MAYLTMQNNRNASSAMENSWVIEWITLQRMQCLVDVLTLQENQNFELERCISRPLEFYDTSFLVLNLPPPPEQNNCPNPITCDTAYLENATMSLLGLLPPV